MKGCAPGLVLKQRQLMDSEPEYQQQDYFNFYPACGTSYNQQTDNCGLEHSAQQNTLSNHKGGTKHTAQHPGTQQYTSDYPGTNQYFSQHPGTNPFSTKDIKTTHHLAQYPGANQHSTQYPGTAQYSTPHLGQYQFGRTAQYTGTAKFPGPPLYTPYLGTAQYPGTNQQVVERMPHNTGSQFQQTATQFSNGTESTRENPCGQVVENIGTSNTGNFNSKVVGNTSAQPQNFNVHQFTSPSGEESQLERPQNNFPEKQGQKPVIANRKFYSQDGKTAEKLESKGEQNQQTEEKQAEESARKEKERIGKSIRIKHLIKSYAKVRTLVSLCRDFDTPVFGDYPGNEGEKTVMKNLALFLKDETNKIKFVCGGEKEKTTLENEDPIMQASLRIFKATISELEKKKGKLEGDKREFENVDKVVKGFAGELEENIKQAATLKTEVEAYNVRLERLKERQKKERQSNESERSLLHKEMEEINKIHVHSLHENLRTLQEKIGEETKGFNEVRRELKNLNERNDSLRARIKEVETINNNFKEILAKSTKVGNTRGQNTGSLSVRTHCNIE